MKKFKIKVPKVVSSQQDETLDQPRRKSNSRLREQDPFLVTNKQILYECRLKDEAHHEKLYVEPSFFVTDNPLKELREVLKKFNKLVEKITGGIEYSVCLKYGIPKIAADFKYQYKKFVKFTKDNGIELDTREKLKKIDAAWLESRITWKESTGKFSLKKSIFEDTENLSPFAILLLILYKAYSSQPNKDPYDYYSQGGITGLSDTRASKLLHCSRRTIHTHRKELTNSGFISENYFDGRYRKINLNI